MNQAEEQKKNGKVWLVGAGPSDPGLLTVKAKQVLERAEVVVYDALVGTAILAMIPEQAEKINVGKRSSHHLMRQEQISELLAAKAKEGKRVVRLKGGDPFLFGRGGEELEVLAARQVPYEVVPGVTSAIAVPAYQGIPVTHRDYCSSVHIITGHKREGQEYDIDFDALVRTKGTLIFLMGVAALKDICQGLLNAGMRPDMPAALLAKGTTSAQERIVSTVSGLHDAVEAHGAVTPAIIVVGEVCALAEEFSWTEQLPLSGIRVFVTRPRELAGTLSEKLRTLGAEVVEVPAIRTAARSGDPEFENAVRHAGEYDWIVFTSPTGVRVFFEELKKLRLDLRSLASAKIAVIGTGSAKELEKYGVYTDLMPEIYDGEHLGRALAGAAQDGEKILIPRAAIGNRELIEELRAAKNREEENKNLEITDIASYDTLYGLDASGDPAIDLDQELAKGRNDYLLFTSASTVRGFAAAAPKTDYSGLRAVCIGRQTEAAAAALGMKTRTAQTASIDSLIEKLLELIAGALY